jgi:hypothetical protein
MSAELLRRAAKVLREHTDRLPEPWRSQPWRVVQTDTENMDGLAACTNAHTDDPYGAFDCCWSSEPVGHASVASLAALMHPPVALALASAFDRFAWMGQRDPDLLRRVGCDEVIAAARAILRKPEGAS